MFVTIFVIILISVVKYKYRPYVLLPRAWYRSAIGGRGKVKGWRKRATGSELASFPGLPRFSSSVCVQYNTRKRKSAKNGEGLVSFIT